MLVTGAVLICIIRSISGLRTLMRSARCFFSVFTHDYAAGRQFLIERLKQRELERKLAAHLLSPQSLVLLVEGDRKLRCSAATLRFMN
jgi:hypothetical protein